MWSAGVVLYAMLYGNVPFKGADMKDLHKQIIDANYELKDEISAGMEHFIHLIHFFFRIKRSDKRIADKKSKEETYSRLSTQAFLAR